MLCTVSPGPASPSCAAVLRCQVTPSREVQITACVVWLPVAATPAARNPSDVLFSTHIASPFSIGAMPWVDASVQDRPFLLVQMACGPTASQPAGPPANRAAGPPAHRGGRMSERGLPAAGRGHWGQAPGGAAVDGDEELLADHAVAGLGAHRDDGVPRGHDAVHGLEDAALLLPGVHADGQRRLRLRALIGGRVRLLARGERA